MNNLLFIKSVKPPHRNRLGGLTVGVGDRRQAVYAKREELATIESAETSTPVDHRHHTNKKIDNANYLSIKRGSAKQKKCHYQKYWPC